MRCRQATHDRLNHGWGGSAVNELEAREEIHTVLASYCRALDRMDKELAYAVWHPEGTAHYIGVFKGTGRGFVDWVWPVHNQMVGHSHQISNSLIELDGDRARSETYVTVALWPRDAERVEISVRGRYLDSWSRRDGRWAIDHRTHVVDLQCVRDISRAPASAASARDQTDASYALFDFQQHHGPDHGESQ